MGPAAAHHHYPGDLYAAGGHPEFVRGFNTQKVFTGLEVAFRGMADAFAGVVMLLVAAGCLPGAEHHRLYSEPDLYRHLVRLGQHYPDAGAGGADHAGGDDHRLR